MNMDYIKIFEDDTLFEAYIADVVGIDPEQLKGFGEYYSDRTSYDLTTFSPCSDGVERFGDQYYNISVHVMLDSMHDMIDNITEIVTTWKKLGHEGVVA